MVQQSQLIYKDLRLNDHTLDDNLFPIPYQPQSHYFHSNPSASLGDLGRLPSEILQEILIQTDLQSLLHFRISNGRALEFVDSIPKFKAITSYARNALQGIISIKTGSWITSRTLFEKLCTPDCEECGDFGAYLYLITCKRVCFLCLTQDKQYLPLRTRQASQKFGLEIETIKALPCMRVIPGIYSPNEKRAKSSVLVDYQSAQDAGISRYGSLITMHEYVADVEAKRLDAYERALEAQLHRPNTRRRQGPRATDSFDGHSGNPFRFVAIVRVPWLNRASKEMVEWGFHCVGCSKSSCPPLHYRRKFTVASFDDHIKQCGDIKNGKHC
ncbi:hypothetical protein BGZ63DRAFT_478851 [Mariannaea sp. PMI_226]|nr:hypothetical protein BGZ63DRAFT_478851 [Mariannaea sp. PMI_226]